MIDSHKRVCWNKRTRQMLLLHACWGTGTCFFLRWELKTDSMKRIKLKKHLCFQKTVLFQSKQHYRAAKFQLQVDTHLRSGDGKDTAVILASAIHYPKRKENKERSHFYSCQIFLFLKFYQLSLSTYYSTGGRLDR